MIKDLMKKILGRKDKQAVKSGVVDTGADVARQTEILKGGNREALRELAASQSTSPVILYYLAKSEDSEIRRAVVTNPSTPVHAASLLAADPSVDVRMALAARIVDLLPGLSSDRQSQLYNYAVQALVMLAQDEVFLIRKALSTALRDDAKAPPAVVSRLARDIEREISEPILRFCIALSDEDLLDILSNHPEPWVVSAVAARPAVSEQVSTAVTEIRDLEATTVLVSNKGVKFAVETLEKIIEQAREVPAWHKPIALRSELTADLARQLSGFVDHAILKVLEQRSDLDTVTRSNVASVVRRRLKYKQLEQPNETTVKKLERFVNAGELTPEVIHDALAWHDREFVIMAIAFLSRVPPQVVQKIFNAHAARPVVALCWKAKLPMRLAVEVQRLGAKIPPHEIIYAKGGTDYPLKEEELRWQLEFFGIKV